MNKKSFVVVFLQLLLTALSAINVIYLADILETSDYGKYIYYLSAASIFPLFAGIGAEHVFLMEGSKERRLIPYFFGNALFVRTIVSIIFMVIATAIVYVFQLPDAAAILLILAGSLISTFSNPLLLSFYRVKGIHIRPWIISCISSIFLICYLLIIPKVLLTFKIVALGFFLSHVSTFLVFIIDTKGRNKIRVNIRYIKKYFKTGILFSVSQAFDYAFSRLDIFIIQFIAGPFFVGVYAAGQRLVSLLQVIPSSFHVVELPEFHRAAWNKKLLNEKFTRLRRLLFELALLLFGLLMLNSQFLIDFLFKDEFKDASVVVILLSIANILLFINYPYYMLAEAINKIKERLVRRIYTFFLTILFVGLGVYFYGIYGAAVGLILGQLVFMILLHLLSVEYNGGVKQLMFDGKSVIIAILAGSIAYGCGTFVHGGLMRLFIISGIYILVFLGAGLPLKMIISFNWRTQ